MTAHTLPGIGLTGDIDQGAPWKVAGDDNWMKSSVLTQLAVESMTTSLPPSPLNGVIYIVPAADPGGNQIAARDNGAWTYFPPQKGWTAYVRDTGVLMNYDGASWVPATAPLAAATGAAQIGSSDGTVQAALDSRVRTLQSYTALLAYAGFLDTQVTAQGIEGAFRYNAAAANTSDGGTRFAHVSGTGAWERLFDGAVYFSWFEPVGDGVANDYAKLLAAYTAAVARNGRLSINKVGSGLYFIGTNEWVVSAPGFIIEQDAGVEIRGNGGASGGYVISFARTGGTAQPGGTHPTNQRVTGLRVRTMAPFAAGTNRAAVRVCGSYGLYQDCSIVTSADNGGGGLLLEADDSGSGPYYNTFNECNLQGPQNGAATSSGVMMRQKAGTAITTRYPNDNTLSGGRSGGYAVNAELCGNGNRIDGLASENFPGFGIAFQWLAPVANSNANNLVLSPYIENAATGFSIDANTIDPWVITPYLTGVAAFSVDPSGRLSCLGGNGVRGLTLATAPNPAAARNGISVGNAANANPQTFDWYDESVPCTPTMKGSTTMSNGTVHSVQVGRATRMGNRLSFNLACAWTSTTETGNIIIALDDLPWSFNATSNTNAVLNIRASNLAWTAGKQLVALTVTGAKQIQLEQMDPAGGTIAAIPMDTAASLFITGDVLL